MINDDFTKLTRKRLFDRFEQERQEWLISGMSEADIFRIHFGEPYECGRGGDYRMWLDERKHMRPDRKYAFGSPVAVNLIDPNGVWISGGRGGLDEVDVVLDLMLALSLLTEMQRVCFIEARLIGRTQAEVANNLGISRDSVKQAVAGALKKLKPFFT